MPGENKSTTESSQQSSTQPWTDAQPLLKKLLSSYGDASTAVTGDQSSALASLSAGANAIPTNFGADSSGAISRLFGSDTAPQVGMLKDAYGRLQGQLGATANGDNLDPMKTPGFGDALDTISNDAINRVKGVYAGSGRDPSGAGSFGQSAARGITQGTAPVIASEADRLRSEQQQAAATLYGAGNTTAGAITGQNQIPLTNALAGISAIPGVVNAYTAPGQARAGAANASYMQPWTNLAALLQPSLGLGAMGSQSQGTGTSTTTQPQSLMGNILGGASGTVGILSAMGAFSDKRMKENIEEVGKLKDGQTVYRYNFKGSPKTEIGLLAQNVARRKPSAVGRHPVGMLMVDYKSATDKAAAMGKAA
jgi:hypothetical protein